MITEVPLHFHLEEALDEGNDGQEDEDCHENNDAGDDDDWLIETNDK